MLRDVMCHSRARCSLLFVTTTTLLRYSQSDLLPPLATALSRGRDLFCCFITQMCPGETGERWPRHETDLATFR